jgi:hypothetical protein
MQVVTGKLGMLTKFAQRPELCRDINSAVRQVLLAAAAAWYSGKMLVQKFGEDITCASL